VHLSPVPECSVCCVPEGSLKGRQNCSILFSTASLPGDTHLLAQSAQGSFQDPIPFFMWVATVHPLVPGVSSHWVCVCVCVYIHTRGRIHTELASISVSQD
jgi:hypothetical protein